jgi:AcrR family transcriptional regulator
MVKTRSTRAHDQVIQAALSLFAERGLDAASMDAIAERSGVSKATIYKHWPDKEALALEAMTTLHLPDLGALHVETGDIRADLVAVLGYKPPLQYSEIKTRIMPHLMAYAARNPAFGLAWRARVIEPPRTQVRRLVTRAQADGLIVPTLDVELAIALLLGPMMYTNMMKVMSATTLPDHPRMAEDVVASFWQTYSTATTLDPDRTEDDQSPVARRAAVVVRQGQRRTYER